MPADPDGEVRVEGVVLPRDTTLSPRLGVAIVCPDAEWYVACDDRSPYQAFVGRRVAAVLAPYEPIQRPLSRIGAKPIRYGRVSAMRFVGATPGDWLLEVGSVREAVGRFAGDAPPACPLVFVTEAGDALRVVNPPPDPPAGGSVRVLAYPVRLAGAPRGSAGGDYWVTPVTAAPGEAGPLTPGRR
jgi:hypothetical protein